MPKYPDEFKDYLKDIAPIQEVISAIIGNVLKSGSNYVAHCPFHDDSTPSLIMKTDNNLWGCHGCGAGTRNHSKATSADVYGFIMGYYSYNLGQAIEWLSNFLNVPLPSLDQKTQFKMSQHQWWINICDHSNQRFRENLYKNRDAYKYLSNRGFEEIDLHIWQIGFGDGEQQEFMNTKGKITFPIHDYNGDIISFTGRVPFEKNTLMELNTKQKNEGKRITPKYDHRWPLKADFVSEDYLRNHPYPEFERNAHLYGLYHAKEYIRQWKTAILVEGYTDVIMMHKRGIKNAVASCGTSLSEQQVLLLKRSGAKRVLLMSDGDDAGLKSMENHSNILLKHGLTVEVCPLPEGHDPDTLARHYQSLDDALSKYILKRTRTLTQWRVEKVYKEQQEEMLYHYSRIGEIQESRMDRVISLLSQESDPIQLDILMRQYAELFVISYESLKEKVMYFKNKIKEGGQNE